VCDTQTWQESPDTAAVSPDSCSGEDHPELGHAHLQYSTGDEEGCWSVSFEHETPSLILWEIVDELLDHIRPNYQYAADDSLS
jgi:hypothetical protein